MSDWTKPTCARLSKSVYRGLCQSNQRFVQSNNAFQDMHALKASNPGLVSPTAPFRRPLMHSVSLFVERKQWQQTSRIHFSTPAITYRPTAQQLRNRQENQQNRRCTYAIAACLPLCRKNESKTILRGLSRERCVGCPLEMLDRAASSGEPYRHIHCSDKFDDFFLSKK